MSRLRQHWLTIFFLFFVNQVYQYRYQLFKELCTGTVSRTEYRYIPVGILSILMTIFAQKQDPLGTNDAVQRLSVCLTILFLKSFYTKFHLTGITLDLLLFCYRYSIFILSSFNFKSSVQCSTMRRVCPTPSSCSTEPSSSARSYACRTRPPAQVGIQVTYKVLVPKTKFYTNLPLPVTHCGGAGVGLFGRSQIQSRLLLRLQINAFCYKYYNIRNRVTFNEINHLSHKVRQKGRKKVNVSFRNFLNKFFTPYITKSRSRNFGTWNRPKNGPAPQHN